ncbi:MAG: ArsR/SmtB family transcription factor [Nocardioides sp.]
MSRRTSTDRHRDSGPPADGPQLIDQLVAFHHPTRQRILECLALHGPATVGGLADRLGLAPGSVSHHLKPLHRAGLVEPAPELGRDTRQSWWREVRVTLSYDAADFPAGSRVRELVTAAERANDDRHVSAIRSWRAGRDSMPQPWQRAGGSQDTTVAATPAQAADLHERIGALLRDWSRECREDAVSRPDDSRRVVLALAHVHPLVEGEPR